jgi:hypothetical protein
MYVINRAIKKYFEKKSAKSNKLSLEIFLTMDLRKIIILINAQFFMISYTIICYSINILNAPNSNCKLIL